MRYTLLYAASMPARLIAHETLKMLGFRSGGDLLASTFGLKLYSAGVLQGLALGAAVAGLTAFCTHWIWNPPSALYLLLFLDLANGRYGYMVAKRLRHEPFSWAEFKRTGGIVISTLIVMAIVRNAINSYPYYDFMADLVFGWLFATKAQKVVAKMVALKVQEQGAASLFQFGLKWLLSSKLGPILVDSIQQPPGRAATPQAESVPDVPIVPPNTPSSDQEATPESTPPLP